MLIAIDTSGATTTDQWLLPPMALPGEFQPRRSEFGRRPSSAAVAARLQQESDGGFRLRLCENPPVISRIASQIKSGRSWGRRRATASAVTSAARDREAGLRQ
ncbi:MAG: hypothetical protein JO224_09585 [Pelomonas sp.]|nr:hypothetical protein [Roseateles sp.]